MPLRSLLHRPSLGVTGCVSARGRLFADFLPYLPLSLTGEGPFARVGAGARRLDVRQPIKLLLIHLLAPAMQLQSHGGVSRCGQRTAFLPEDEQCC